jgi:hypothetical protein
MITHLQTQLLIGAHTFANTDVQRSFQQEQVFIKPLNDRTAALAPLLRCCCGGQSSAAGLEATSHNFIADAVAVCERQKV